MPATAAIEVVPDSVPVAGFVPIVMLMLPTKLGTVLPCASCAATVIGGEITVPAVVLPAGPTLKVSLDAVPGVMSNAMLVPSDAPVAVADSVPAEGEPPFVPIATVTLPLKVVTRLPKASSPETATAGAMGDPAWV